LAAGYQLTKGAPDERLLTRCVFRCDKKTQTDVVNLAPEQLGETRQPAAAAAETAVNQSSHKNLNDSTTAS